MAQQQSWGRSGVSAYGGMQQLKEQPLPRTCPARPEATVPAENVSGPPRCPRPAAPARTQAVAHQPAVVVGHLEGGLALDGGREVAHGGGELHAQVPHLPAVVERRGEVAAGPAGTEQRR